uniref:Orf101a n=1 Tax=Batis maritima TaxID=4436 RepID=A0A068BF96_BATMA|nr:orf101a [Batis maritima]AIC83374.1 orf101a [Batis maritima]
MECIDLGHFFSLFSFQVGEDFHRVIYVNPCFVVLSQSKALGACICGMGAEATFTTIAVWVQLGGLPIEFYYMTTLNRLGKEWNLRVDKEREERARSTLWIA